MTETSICGATSSIAPTDGTERNDFGGTTAIISDVENTEIPPTSLDEPDGISGIQTDNADISFWLSVILMVSNTPSEAEFDSVIGYVREVGAELDKAVDGLEHPPREDALGYANGMRSGFDTTLITLAYLARLAGRVPSVHPIQTRKTKPLLHVCEKCELAYFPDHDVHDCAKVGGFTQRDLDRLVGPNGYRIRYTDGSVEPDDDPGFEPKSSAAPEVVEVYDEEPKPLGMREGSKKHRVWVATEKLLEDGNEMHIDEMLRTVGRSGLFDGVKEPRARFANLLSQYRGLGIIESDNQGNYWLPNGKATD